MLYRHNPNLKLISEFKGFEFKVKIIDGLGIEYLVNPRSLLQNKTPHISGALNKTKAFNTKLSKIFIGLQLNKPYTKGNIKTEVIDNLGIIYLVKPESLLQGRHPSIRTAINKNKAFKIKAKLVHGNRYDYSKIEYIGDKKKVKIICNIHGEFWQQPNNHITQHQGCPLCTKSRGWSKSQWLKFTENKQCRFYIIECYDNNERFIKCGISSNSVEKRFQSKKEMPYNYKIITNLECSGEECWNKEQDYLKKYKKDNYIPKLNFKGFKECFNINIKNLIQ